MLIVIRRYVNIPIPEFTEDEGQGLVAYRLLPGRRLYGHDVLRLGETAQEPFAEDLANFLRDLHNIPATMLIEANILLSSIPSDSRSIWQEGLDAICADLYPKLWADQHAYIEHLFIQVLEGWVDM